MEHPDVASRMKEEINDVCGSRTPTINDIKKMKYGEPISALTRYNPA